MSFCYAELLAISSLSLASFSRLALAAASSARLVAIAFFCLSAAALRRSCASASCASLILHKSSIARWRRVRTISDQEAAHSLASQRSHIRSCKKSTLEPPLHIFKNIETDLVDFPTTRQTSLEQVFKRLKLLEHLASSLIEKQSMIYRWTKHVSGLIELRDGVVQIDPALLKIPVTEFAIVLVAALLRYFPTSQS